MGDLSRDDKLDVEDRNSENLIHLIELAVSVRSKLRAIGQWKLADEIRDRLLEVGIALKDFSNKITQVLRGELQVSR